MQNKARLELADYEAVSGCQHTQATSAINNNNNDNNGALILSSSVLK